MMKKLFLLSIIVAFTLSIGLQAQNTFTEDFNDNMAGWLALSDMEWSYFPTIENGECHMQYTNSESIATVMVSPIGAVRNFTFEVSGKGGSAGADVTGFVGISAEGNLMEYHVLNGETLQLIVGNIISADYDVLYESQVDATDGEYHTMKIDVSGSLPELIITIWWDGTQMASEVINDVVDVESIGHIGFFAQGDEVDMYYDNVNITYTPIYDNDIYTENFDDGHAEGWLAFCDESWELWPTVESGACHLNYSSTTQTGLAMLSPVGSVSEFSFETTGRGGEEGAETTGIFAISAEGNYLKYHVVEGVELELIHGNIHSGDPETAYSQAVDATNENWHNMKMDVSGTAPNLTVKIWWDDELVHTEYIDNAPIEEAQGHVGVFVYGDTVDVWFDDITIAKHSGTSIDGTEQNLPFTLHQNYPNPFSETTTISYELFNRNYVQLSLFDASGKCIEKVVDGDQGAGQHNQDIDASHLAPGVYFIHLNAGNNKVTKKCVVTE